MNQDQVDQLDPAIVDTWRNTLVMLGWVMGGMILLATLVMLAALLSDRR